MSSTSDRQQFIQRFSEIEDGLYRYILVLVHRDADAQDILQETAIALWKKWEQYDSELPFAPWARRFAYTEVMKFRLYQSREGEKRTAFPAELIDQLSEEYAQHEEVFELRLEALQGCYDKLSEDDRVLLQARYWNDTNLRKLAQVRGVSEDHIYRRLSKLRRILERCIQQSIAEQQE